jgi:integrase
VDDVDLKEQKILIYQAYKTGVGRVVYYSDDAQRALLAWLKMRDPFKDRLFYGQGKASQSLGYLSILIPGRGPQNLDNVISSKSA